MAKILLLLSLLSVAVTTAFLPSPRNAGFRRSHSSLFQNPNKNRADEKTTIASLEKDFQTLKETLRHDLFHLKQKQCQVAQEETDLLQEAVVEVEFDRFAQEEDAMATQDDLEQAHKAVEKAQALKKRALAEMEFAIDHADFLQSMEEAHRDLESFLLLEQAANDLKQSQDFLQASQEVEREALQKERRSEGLLKFLEQKEAHLKEIAQDPKALDVWAEEELALHESLLQVATMEWEYQKLWHQLQDDLLDLKHQKVQVAKEEEVLTAKAAELVALKEKEQVEQVKAVFADMQEANKALQQAVANKEKAHQNTLTAIDKANLLHSQKTGDYRGLELWRLAEAAQKLQATNQVVHTAKDKQRKAILKEGQAEELLLLLKQKERALKKLRLPGNEEALQKWIRDELSDHESLLRLAKGNLPLD